MTMKNYDEQYLVNWLKLSLVKGLGPSRITRLFEHFNSFEEILDASSEKLFSTRIFNEKMIEEWNKLKSASEDNFHKVVQECQEKNILIMPLIDPRYPKKLKQKPSPPMTLYLWGDVELLDRQIIAIVGTREPSEKAVKFAYDSAKGLSKKNFVIASGGARGIDTAAHRGCLDASGKTICILANGFFQPYPPENAPLFDEIRQKGGLLVSENTPNFPGNRFAFINRNRITSGISEAVLLCASLTNGGAMVQTKIAYEQRVPIFVPSTKLGIKPNEGIFKAIETYKAKEIQSAGELENCLASPSNYSLNKYIE